MRKCNKCGKHKDETAFSPSPYVDKQTGLRRGDGLRWVCKACTALRQRKYIASLPPDKKETVRKRRVKQIREYNKAHPCYQKAGKANQHAKRVGADGKVRGVDVIAVWDEYDGKCWCCGYDATEIDHYRPINKKAGGTNTADNIRPICRECNQKRSHFWHGDAVAIKEAKLLKQLKKLLLGDEE